MILATRDETTTDRMDFLLENGKLKVSIAMGPTEKSAIVGDRLNDDEWHSVSFSRHGMMIKLSIDDEQELITEIFGSERFLDYSALYVGAIPPGEMMSAPAPNFVGQVQQLIFNDRPYLEQMRRTGASYSNDVSLSANFLDSPMLPYATVTFNSQNTYIGLTPLKANYDIAVSFMFRTLEANGLIMYNGGHDKDFFAIELVNGHIHYTVNLGYAAISIKDSSPRPLNDNRWHSVSVSRLSMFKHSLVIDDKYAAFESARGKHVHLDLNGALFLGKLTRLNLSPLASNQLKGKLGVLFLFVVFKAAFGKTCTRVFLSRFNRESASRAVSRPSTSMGSRRTR